MVRIEAHIPIPKSWPKYKHEQARQGEIKPTGKPDIDNFIKAALSYEKTNRVGTPEKSEVA